MKRIFLTLLLLSLTATLAEAKKSRYTYDTLDDDFEMSAPKREAVVSVSFRYFGNYFLTSVRTEEGEGYFIGAMQSNGFTMSMAPMKEVAVSESGAIRAWIFGDVGLDTVSIPMLQYATQTGGILNLSVSDIGKRFLFTSASNDRTYLWIDGEKLDYPFESIRSVTLAEHSRDFAFVFRRGKMNYINLNGTNYATGYANIESIRLSANGKSFGFIYNSSDWDFVNINGKSAPQPFAAASKLRFSQDGSNSYFVAQLGTAEYIYKNSANPAVAFMETLDKKRFVLMTNRNGFAYKLSSDKLAQQYDAIPRFYKAFQRIQDFAIAPNGDDLAILHTYQNRSFLYLNGIDILPSAMPTYSPDQPNLLFDLKYTASNTVQLAYLKNETDDEGNIQRRLFAETFTAQPDGSILRDLTVYPVILTDSPNEAMRLLSLSN